MKRIIIFEKKELKLVNEDGNKNDVTIDVDNNNSTEIAKELNKPNVTGVTAPTANSTENNEILVQVPTKPTDTDVKEAGIEAQKQFRPILKPGSEFKYVEGGVNTASRSLRENAVRFSKKELNSFLKNI